MLQEGESLKGESFQVKLLTEGQDCFLRIAFRQHIFFSSS